MNLHSFRRSIVVQTDKYLKDYQIPKAILDDQDKLFDLVDSIFFFWIKNSSSSNYSWTSTCSSFKFLNSDHSYAKYLILKRIGMFFM
jgi:hypothetical protein